MLALLRTLLPATGFVAAILIVTMAVLTWSPAFVAVMMALSCGLAARLALRPVPDSLDLPPRPSSDDVTRRRGDEALRP